MAFFESRRRYEGDDLRATARDRMSSLILAGLVLVGTIVLVLFGLLVFPQQPDEVVMTYRPALVDAEDHPDYVPQEFETPDPNELPGIPLLQTPALFAASVDEAMEEVRQVDASLLTELNLAPETQLSEPSEWETIPRWERWKIDYITTDLADYAKQLDYFEIELAVAGGGKRNVDYASRFSNSRPDSRSAPGNEDERLYIVSRADPIRKKDEQLLRQVGIVTNKRLILHFYSEDFESTLAELELEHTNGRPIEEIQSTSFGVQRRDGGYEVFVDEQTYRQPEKESGDDAEQLDPEVLISPR